MSDVSGNIAAMVTEAHKPFSYNKIANKRSGVALGEVENEIAGTCGSDGFSHNSLNGKNSKLSKEL